MCEFFQDEDEQEEKDDVQQLQEGREQDVEHDLVFVSDYQWGDPVSGQCGITKVMGTRTWYAWCLTDINQWSPCLRIDQNVIASEKTHILRAQLNCRVVCWRYSANFHHVNVFIVSLRKEVTNTATIQRRGSWQNSPRLMVGLPSTGNWPGQRNQAEF